MKIICKYNEVKNYEVKKESEKYLPEFMQGSFPELILGKEYIPLGLILYKESREFCYLLNEEYGPFFYPASLFEITNGQLLADWHINIINDVESNIIFLCGYFEFCYDKNYHDNILECEPKEIELYFKKKYEYMGYKDIIFEDIKQDSRLEKERIKKNLVVSALIEKNNKILLVKRKDSEFPFGTWELPGNDFSGENSMDIFMKENIQKKLDIEVRNSNYIGSYNYYHKDIDCEVCLYKVSDFSGEIKSQYYLETIWVEPLKIPEYDVYDFNMLNPSSKVMRLILKNIE